MKGKNPLAQQSKKYSLNKATYLSQVRQLRILAKKVLLQYKLTWQKLDFIQHGENATFKVTTTHGARYLLRIHRGGYHTNAAIYEELDWLTRLAKKRVLRVPKPVASRNKRFLEIVKTSQIPEGRSCCLFEWIDGHHLEKNLRIQHMHQLGQLIAVLQKTPFHRKVKERRYWLADGLVGKQPKFGTIDHIKGLSPRLQRIISRGRALSYRKLKQFEKRYPERTGLIHADMHWGNVLRIKGELAPIDFDDCGLGFFAYDLAVALMSTRNRLEKKRKSEIPVFRQALIDGYSSIANWDQADEAILPHLLIARELMGLSWINTRSDNPRLRKYLKPVTRRVVQQIKREYGL